MPRNQQTAGAFDIRNVIGGLIGLYGIVLTFMGIFGDKALDKTGGVNANLWAGLVMIVVGAGFLAWARLRPVVVEHQETGPEPAAAPQDDAR
jgi:hypothetical protein